MEDLTKNCNYSQELTNGVLNTFNQFDAELEENKLKCLSWVMRAFYEKYKSYEVCFDVENYVCPCELWVSDNGIKDCLIEKISMNKDTFEIESITIRVNNTNQTFVVDYDELYRPNIQEFIGAISYQIENKNYTPNN